MSCFKIIGLLVLEKKVLQVFAIYSHGGHLGHVTLTIYTNIHFPFLTMIYKSLSLIGQAVSGKAMFEYNGHAHVYSPVAGANNPLGAKFFSES